MLKVFKTATFVCALVLAVSSACSMVPPQSGEDCAGDRRSANAGPPQQPPPQEDGWRRLMLGDGHRGYALGAWNPGFDEESRNVLVGVGLDTPLHFVMPHVSDRKKCVMWASYVQALKHTRYNETHTLASALGGAFLGGCAYTGCYNTRVLPIFRACAAHCGGPRMSSCVTGLLCAAACCATTALGLCAGQATSWVNRLHQLLRPAGACALRQQERNLAAYYRVCPPTNASPMKSFSCSSIRKGSLLSSRARRRPRDDTCRL